MEETHGYRNALQDTKVRSFSLTDRLLRRGERVEETYRFFRIGLPSPFLHVYARERD